jgi:hypothetical protein
VGSCHQRFAKKSWDEIDWTQPIVSIADQQGCSRQRVYYMMKVRGIKRPPPTLLDRIRRIRTELYTVPQLSTHLKCRSSQIAELLRMTNKSCRLPSPKRTYWRERKLFVGWLVRTHQYSRKIASDFASRLIRVQTAYGSEIQMYRQHPKGHIPVLSQMEQSPEKLRSPETKQSTLAPYRLAVKRYSQFLDRDSTVS